MTKRRSPTRSREELVAALNEVSRQCAAVQEDIRWGFSIAYGTGRLPLPRRELPAGKPEDPPPSYGDTTGETVAHAVRQRIRAQLGQMERYIRLMEKAGGAAAALGHGIDRILSPKSSNGDMDADWLGEPYKGHRKISHPQYEAAQDAQRRRRSRGEGWGEE